MTRRISAVAVCCSSDSVSSAFRALQLLEQPHVLDGDDGLRGKGLQEADLTVREGTYLPAVHGEGANEPSLLQQGDHQKRSHALELDNRSTQRVAFGEGRVREHIVDVHRAELLEDPGQGRVRPGPDGSAPVVLDERRLGAPEGGGVVGLAVEEEQSAALRLAQPRGVVEDRVEHGLDVGRRARDDAQDLGGGRLLLQRLGQLAVSSLQLLEQPHALDGDHGLIGEARHELDLLVGEGPNVGPPDHDHADDGALPEHRHCQDRPDLVAPLTRGPPVLGVGEHVVDVDGPALEDGSTGCRLSTGTDGIAHDDFKELGRRSAGGHPEIELPVLRVRCSPCRRRTAGPRSRPGSAAPTGDRTPIG